MRAWHIGKSTGIAAALLAVGLAACGSSPAMGGVHARFGFSDDGLFVRDVPADGPAQMAGLKVGDEVLTIDGHPVKELSEPQVVERLRGPVGSLVSLEVRRDGSPKPISLTVERADYATASR